MNPAKHKWNPGDLVIFGNFLDGLYGIHFMKDSKYSYFSMLFHKGKMTYYNSLKVGGNGSLLGVKVIKIK